MVLYKFDNVIFSINYANYVKGPFACELYAMFGSLFGVTSIWTMVFIALDRYNVIVKVKIKYKYYLNHFYLVNLYKK